MSTQSPNRTMVNTATSGRFPDKSPNRAGVPTSTGQGLARNPSLRSARPIRKAPLRTSTSGDGIDEDAKAANAQVIADLKEQMERAEQASEHYRRQLEAMQKRIDDGANEQTASEEREFGFRTQIDKLQAELRDNARQSRELETTYESEKKILLQDRERQNNKEAELHSVVNRLTESLKFKNQELNHSSRRDSLADRTNSDKDKQDSLETNSQDYFQMLQEKNNMIETLRLELADFQMQMAEQEHMGDGKSQVLEKQLLDIKMHNARLQEENESFQMLLSEKTLKGDFMHDQAQGYEKVSSLAEELEVIGEDGEVSPDAYRRMEIENKTLRESNKALTLYVDKIIGRLLQHEGFEKIITEKDDMPPSSGTGASAEKALPAIPPQGSPATSMGPPEPPKASPASASVATAASAAAGFLQRARSVVSRPAAPKPRPASYMPPAVSSNENPETAPSIPISHKHRRARSDQANDLGAAAVVQQMNRGSPLRTISGGPLSPGISPLSPITGQRPSYFVPPASNTNTGRVPSSSISAGRNESSSNSIVSDRSLDIERDSTDASSNRASIYGAAGTGLPGAVMKQNQLRPLRLVQEQAQADEDASKKANRGSWMGWFNKGTAEPPAE